MNKHVHPLRTDEIAGPDYDSDAYGWAMTQARLLRERQANALDWDNIAEEIESMGRSEWRSAESALRIVLLHRLKWKYQAARRSRSWLKSIDQQLLQFDFEIEDNPSLKPRMDELREGAYRKARREAARETGLDIETFPERPPSWEEIRGPLPD